MSQTLPAALDEAAEHRPDAPSLLWSDGVLTYGGLRERAHALAAAYRALGIRPGDRIVCQLPNRPEFLLAAYASWTGGAVHVGADHDLTPHELTRLVDRTEAAAVVLPHTAADHLDAIRRHRPAPQVVVCGGHGPDEGAHALDDLLGSSAPSASLRPPGSEDPALIFFTSGTTGAPKGVVRYHGQLLEAWRRMATALRATPEDVHLVQLPLSHGFGFGLAIAGLLTGGRLVLVERFAPGEVLPLLGREQVSVLHGTPAHFRLLIDGLDRARHDVSSLRIGVASGAAFPTELLRRIYDDLQMDLILTYGTSEGIGCATDDRDDILRGSVGRPPLEYVRIVDPEGRPLPLGKVGEIVARKTHTVRYWDDGPTGEDHDPDWYPTGDLGRVDEEGRLYVLGRVGHQIDRGGLFVDPEEVETALLDHPGLADAAVTGLPDPVLGEVVCACVVPSDEGPPALEDLRRLLEPRLARHKLPEALCLLEEVPRTAVGKVDRPALRARAEAAPTHERLRGGSTRPRP